MRYKDTEYTYISAKVRAMEASLVGRYMLDRMIAAEDTDAAAAYLRECGLELSGLTAAERENVLVGELGRALSEIEKNAPSPGVFAFFRYPYDCSNAKAVIKCRVRGIDPEGMLFSVGTVNEKDIISGFDKLPENMRAAAWEAEKAYTETKNPQLIDFILDRACYADMEKCSEQSGIEFVKNIVDVRADMTNFMIALRVLRMGCGEYGESVLKEALLPVGKIGRSAFLRAFAGGEEGIIAAIARGGYSALAEKLSVGISLSAAEKLCDNEKTEQLKAAKYKTYGIEIPVAYIAAVEAEIQNIRIVLAGKDAGIAQSEIVERTRDSYV
ncbi:MAG: hypothetical protein E7640_02175 [Ruminococcaceae bacterium]|nr:hypothetical protein [Oscillospiraceae bacterium]